MKIDNQPVIPNRPPTQLEKDFWDKLTAILLKEEELPYAESVRAYRQLEAEFVNQATDSGATLDINRPIAETIFSAGCRQQQPFEVCRDNWNVLVELGFSNVATYCSMAWHYVDACVYSAQYEVGLEMIDMVTTEIQCRLEDPALTKQANDFYHGQLLNFGILRERLIAYKSSEAEGIAWDERREAEIDARPCSDDENYQTNTPNATSCKKE